MCKGQDSHRGFAGVATDLDVCIWRCTHLCMSVCVLAETRVEAMRVPLCAFWEPCDIPHGRQKDNVTVRRGARGKQSRERMNKEESQES